jgi:hypothetical protein
MTTLHAFRVLPRYALGLRSLALIHATFLGLSPHPLNIVGDRSSEAPDKPTVGTCGARDAANVMDDGSQRNISADTPRSRSRRYAGNQDPRNLNHRQGNDTKVAAEASNGSEQSHLTGSSYSAEIADKCFRTLNVEGPKLRYHQYHHNLS